MPIALSINVNKIALLRNSRGSNYPNVREHAKRCIELGAQGITVHPRPDLRHIRPDDCQSLKALTDDYANIEFNIEGNPLEPANEHYPGFVNLVLANKPEQVTLVPDANQQLTSDHGFDLRTSSEQLEPIIAQFKRAGIRVSLFMDPDPEQITLAAGIGADRVELYTGPFAQAFANGSGEAVFELHRKAAVAATNVGLGINAGHDLNLPNLQLYRQLPNLLEVSIGHAFTVDALHMGLEATINAYLNACATPS